MSDATPAGTTAAKTGELATTLATWIFLLFQSGHTTSDDAVNAACADLTNPESSEDPDVLGQRLAVLVEAAVGEAATSAEATAWLEGLYGAEHIASFSGDTRDDRLQAARAYQFQSSLPWLAVVVDRFPDGSVGPHWVMVERVTDTVTCADPYPWDDLDEEYEQDVHDFLVKWELAGLQSVHWQR